MRRTIVFPSFTLLLIAASGLFGQEPKKTPVRGSLVEDRAARKMIEAGEARMDADESAKAVEIWQSIIERYPRSRVRYTAHMRLGDYYLNQDRAYDRARDHFMETSHEENRDEEQRTEATLKVGVCFYHVRNFGKCFKVMRNLIEQYPVSPQVNQAYYYIGLGHFQLGHYSRAIASLEKVGTTISGDEGKVEKLEAGKRLFVKIEDADLAVLEPGQPIEVEAVSDGGDVERFKCYPIGRHVRIVLGSIPTRLGRPIPNSGVLEVKGLDRVKVTYVDRHTADKELDRKVLRDVTVVGNGHVQITDGAYSETLRGVVLDKGVNVQISDADRDLTDKADTLAAAVEVYRYKTEEELEAEATAAAARADEEKTEEIELDEDGKPKIDPLKLIDRAEITLREVVVQRVARRESPTPTAPKTTQPETPKTPAGDTPAPTEEPAKAPGDKKDDPADTPSAEAKPVQPVDDGSIHTGIFRAVVPLAKTDKVVAADDTLQALPGDVVRVVYLDEKHRGEGTAQRLAQARCLEGNIGGVRVTRAVISDQELRIKTKLKTASALTNIGNRYKEFGLKDNAKRKYEEALSVCNDIMTDARKLGGRLLEESYVQLGKIYFEMDRFNLAIAMAERLQREFPGSGYVDDAFLQLANVARKKGEFNKAIGIFGRLVGMKSSQLRGDAQFGIAACYDDMADQATGAGQAQLYDRAFQEYKKVFDQFPESGRVGEAVAKMADHYYQQKDYARAIDTFETVLSNHPDAKFLDVILFNYGRCLLKMNRRGDARQKFDQLIAEFPESKLAPNAKKISELLARAGK